MNAFMVSSYLRSYGTMRYALALQLRWVVLINTKIFYPMVEQPAEFLCSILPPLASTYSRRGGGWAGVDSPYLRAYLLVQQMARMGAFWMNRKPAARGRSETMPEMGEGQGMGTRQSKSLGGSAAMVGSVGGGRDVRHDFSLDDCCFGLRRKPLVGNNRRGKIWIGSECSPSAGAAPFPTGVTATPSEAPVKEPAAARFPVQSALPG